MRLFNREVLLFMVVPLLMNSILAFASYSYSVNYLHANPTVRYLLIALALGNSLLALLALMVHELNPKQTLLAIVAQGAALYFIVAGFFRS
jgi:hypothetical protein